MFSEEKRANTCLIIVIGCLALSMVAACGVVLVAAGIVAVSRERVAADRATVVAIAATQAAQPLPTLPATPTPPLLNTITPLAPKVTPTSGPGATATAAEATDIPPGAGVDPTQPQSLDEETLATLLALDMPPHDYFETAVRLGRRDVGPRTVNGTAYVLGDDHLFQTDNGVTRATLRAVTDHAYFWVEDDVSFDEVALSVAADRFEREYYPEITALFGEEWRPGVDNEPHFSVLHLRDFGTAQDLGFFASTDEYPRTLNGDSNEQEIIYLNLRYLDIGEELYYGTLVHELEHLIHWHMDPNESTWLDEGLAQLGEIYLSLQSASTGAYLRQPDTQLNRWALDDEESAPYYAAAYLFAVYFWEQLGESAVKRLARHPADGLASVHAVLTEFRPELTLEQLIANWAAATYLDDPSAGAAYGYDTFDLRRPAHTHTVDALPYSASEQVAPYTVQYVDLELSGPTTIAFTGDQRTPLLPVAPHGGERVWLGRGPNNSQAQMTAVFDLTNAASVSFDFWAWYDLEPDWDFAYLSASTDSGQTWTLLVPDHAAAGTYGPAFNGRSADAPDAIEGWVLETVSLNQFAGEIVWLRFEVLTDASVPSAGFAVDDITLKAAGYTGDAETAAGRWQENGFARVGQFLPQRWTIMLLEAGTAGSRATALPLDNANQGRWTVNLGDRGGVLAIIAQAPFARERAVYSLTVTTP